MHCKCTVNVGNPKVKNGPNGWKIVMIFTLPLELPTNLLSLSFSISEIANDPAGITLPPGHKLYLQLLDILSWWNLIENENLLFLKKLK